MQYLPRLDPVSGMPLHRQLYNALRNAILDGSLRPGDKLAATRALAEQLGISRTTVSEAYDQLRSEGYAEARPGSGTYVAPDLPQELSVGSVTPEVPLVRPFPLSAWGDRLLSFSDLRASGATYQATFPYDFRPHRVDQNHFPWQSWHTAVERALSRSRRELLTYPPPAGHPDLLEGIAAHVQAYRGVRCEPGQVVIVNGTQQGLNLLAELLLDGGDSVAVEDPGFPGARMSFIARGLNVFDMPVDGEGMVVETLQHAPQLKLIHVTPSHQDPTGATLSLGRRLALLDIAEQAQALVLEDDYDSEFRYEGHPVESLQGLDRSGLVIYAGTFSKSVLPGLRIGFLVLPKSLVQPFVAAKLLWDNGAPVLDQAALAEFINSGDFERHIRRMRRVYRRRRDTLIASLEATFGNRAVIGQRHGGLNILVELHVETSELDIVQGAAEAGVGILPGSRYFSVKPERPMFVMGFGAVSDEHIPTGVNLLAGVVR